MTCCHRCLTELSYAGRPCPQCMSPARFELKAGKLIAGDGVVRASRVRLPGFALSPLVRGKNIRAPRRQRAISALHTIGRWTWNSLGIALLVHALLFAVAFYFRNHIDEAIKQVHKLAFAPETAAPITAPEKSDMELPDMTPADDTLQIPREVSDDMMIEAGDPDLQAPEPVPFAPEPQVAAPYHGPEMPLKLKAPQAAEGMGGGQPSPSRNQAASGSGLFQNRKGDARAAALKRFGGGPDTENAVNLGLEYLSRQQSSDGSWDPAKGHEVRNRWANDDSGYRGALTALCTLPFLAAGNSPDEGRYSGNVRRSIAWLTRNQTSDGCLAQRGVMQMYGHMVATLVMCEVYGMTGEEKYRTVAERAVRFIERTQNAGGGWDYQATISSSSRLPQRNDLSISGWAVLALKDARSVGLRVSDTAWNGVADLYDRLSMDTGETYYADREYGDLPSNRMGIGMVGVGLTARTILDNDRFYRRNAAAERLLLENKPDYARFSDPSWGAQNPNFNTFYGWYYGTLGMFLKNAGQGSAWEQWNNALKDQLLKNQVLAGSRKGSWGPDDSWLGPLMGDLYTTSCAVLCLEVYYRYNPMHRPESEITPLISEKRADLPGQPELKPAKMEKPVEIAGEMLDLARVPDRSKYLRLLAREQGKAAVAPLMDALKDESPTVRTTALYELGKLKAVDAVDAICGMISRSENRDLRLTICDTLGKIADRSAAQPLVKLLADQDQTVVGAAQRALVMLAGGKDLGTNRHAWADYFGVNP